MLLTSPRSLLQICPNGLVNWTAISEALAQLAWVEQNQALVEAATP
jgi:hypothetical protein